jgi:multiple sugar transport system permease protein
MSGVTTQLSRYILGPAFKWLLLLAVVFWSAFPIFYMVLGSFHLPADIWAYPPKILAPLSLQSYQQVATDNPTFFADMWNSVLSTVLGAIVTLLVALGAAFVFSRMKMGWLRLPALLLITIRMFPPIVVIIPLFPVMNALGLLDTLAPLVFAGAAFGVSIATLLLKAFIDDIPPELEEAALIDGCTRFQAFYRVTLPLIAPGLAAVVVFISVGLWNEYLLPLVFTSSNARTAPVTIAIAINNIEGVQWGMLLAMSTIHLIPMLVLVMLMHKRLVQGMTMGAVKG